MQSAALEIGRPHSSREIIVACLPTNILAAKKAVKENSVEKDIAQYIKKEVSQAPEQLMAIVFES